MKRLALVLTVLAMFSSPVFAQESGDGFMGSGDRAWSLGFYLWATGTEGDIGVGPFQVPVDLSFSDILEDLDFALFVHLEWHSRSSNWGFMTDLSYLKISASDNLPIGRISSRIEMTWLEAAIMYNLASRESPFDLFLGFRTWDMDLSIGFDAASPSKGMAPPTLPPDGATINGGAEWTDLMFGGRWAPRIGNKWWLILRADYATGDSDTLNLAGNFMWRFGRSANLVFGYRYMDLDYSTGAGVNRRALDVQFSGPVAAINFTF